MSAEAWGIVAGMFVMYLIVAACHLTYLNTDPGIVHSLVSNLDDILNAQVFQYPQWRSR